MRLKKLGIERKRNIEFAARAFEAYHDMKIALLQVNPTVGDLSGNAGIILDALRRAAALGADLAVTPELALVGYLPRDLSISIARSNIRRAYCKAERRI